MFFSSSFSVYALTYVFWCSLCYVMLCYEWVLACNLTQHVQGWWYSGGFKFIIIFPCRFKSQNTNIYLQRERKYFGKKYLGIFMKYEMKKFLQPTPLTIIPAFIRRETENKLARVASVVAMWGSFYEYKYHLRLTYVSIWTHLKYYHSILISLKLSTLLLLL